MKKIAAIALAFVVLASPAYATDINVGNAYDTVLLPLLMAVATAMAGVITAAATYAVSWLRNKTGIQALELDAQHRAALESSVTSAAGLVLNQIGNKLDGKVISINDPLLGMAVDYAIKVAPAAIQHFGLDKDIDLLKQKIIAKIPQVANTTGA